MFTLAKLHHSKHKTPLVAVIAERSKAPVGYSDDPGSFNYSLLPLPCFGKALKVVGLKAKS